MYLSLLQPTQLQPGPSAAEREREREREREGPVVKVRERERERVCSEVLILLRMVGTEQSFTRTTVLRNLIKTIH